MNEFAKYSIEDLYEMTQADDPEAMAKQAKAWSNNAALYKQQHEDLKRNLGKVKGKWTSSSADPYFKEVHKTLSSIHAAWKSSEDAAAALASLSVTVSRNRDNIAAEHRKWMEAKSKATGAYHQQMKLWQEDPAKYRRKYPQNFGLPPWEPDHDAVRKPFDEAGRAHMNDSLQKVKYDSADITKPDQELHSYKPVAVPPRADDPWLSPGPRGWGHDGKGGSNSADTAGLAATSYGGTASGTHSPALQSTVPTMPAGGGPAVAPPPGPGIGPLPHGMPVGGVPPLGRTPTPPVLKPVSPSPAEPVGPRSAPRTPGLPARSGPRTNAGRTSFPEERVPGNRTGRTGRTGGVEEEPLNGRAGRGLVRSRMEAVDRTGQPRRPGEVMGRKASGRPPAAAEEEPLARGPIQRRVQPAVVRGARESTGGRTLPAREPLDNTARGYTSKVIGQRTLTAREFSRTPLVARKLEHGAGGRIIGKREEPISEAARLIAERRAARAERLAKRGELSRPVIGNGISRPAQLDEAETAGAETVAPEEDFWAPPATVSGVIGTRRPLPEFDHDPGPGVISCGSAVAGDAEPETRFDPGPTAFHGRRARPDTANWPH